MKAFSELGLPLVVIGEGPERKRLEALAGPNINSPVGRPTKPPPILGAPRHLCMPPRRILDWSWRKLRQQAAPLSAMQAERPARLSSKAKPASCSRAGGRFDRRSPAKV